MESDGTLYPDSNFSLQQTCTANLQAYSKVDTTRAQAYSKLTQASKSPRDELAANLPRQTHRKHSRVRTQPRIRTRGLAIASMTL
ncbi:hypothetical protein AVEN_124160-1 [Araneus ventricosus]|uniref:Uncharacterized protein n=1 Tax=Araneus ventricosus TaxID=182803 RepID=A0A4Y2P109_ARAVE|nr:hypothetical protein AVEN_124160-1 [Araneus ventricosus]